MAPASLTVIHGGEFFRAHLRSGIVVWYEQINGKRLRYVLKGTDGQHWLGANLSAMATPEVQAPVTRETFEALYAAVEAHLGSGV